MVEKENIFGTTGVATDFFPAPTFRVGQREAIEEIESCYEQGYQYVILNGPVGSGKSFIAGAFAFQTQSAHILTVQKLLQNQYKKDFKQDMFIMMGRSAYSCELDEMANTCADGVCQRRKLTPDELKSHRCPYRSARQLADHAPVTVHNFDSFYYQNMGKPYAGRSILIVDECHDIENKFLEFMSFTITNRNRPELVIPEYHSIREYDAYLKVELQATNARIQKLESLKEADGITSTEIRELQDATKLSTKLDKYVRDRERDAGGEYVYDYVRHSKHQTVTFRPINVGTFITEKLFPYGERILMMSGSVLDKEIFCKSIGLSPSDVAMVDMPNTFPVENRPIIKKYAGKMGYNNINATLPKAVNSLIEIMNKFPDKKGIVQTHSEKIAQYIQEHVDSDRLTFNKDYDTPMAMLEVHKDKPGSIIVASGLREGLDLKGELSQIQIFFKVPYPSLGDKRVKRKMEIDPDWYIYTTALMFVQALGRSVRSDEDKAVTYILDSGFGYFYHQAKRFIPDYIKEAIK